MHQRPTMRMFLPFILLLALLAGMVALVLTFTARQTDRIESQNAEQRIAAVLQAEVLQMASIVNDNALWDDAAIGVYGKANVEFLWGTWGAPTAESENYHISAVVDQAGSTLMAYEDGKASTGSILTRFPALRSLALQADKQKEPQGGFVMDHQDMYVVAVDNIMPIDRDLERLVPASGPHRLFILRRISDSNILEYGQRAGISNLSIATPETEPGPSFAFRDLAGRSLATLTWDAEPRGFLALKSVMPVLGFCLFLSVILTVLIFRDWQIILRQFHSEARTDSLSGLPNRRALRAEISERLAAGQPMAIAMLDLDGFKAVNDRFGHLAGDRLIYEVSTLLQEIVGTKGRVARLGGDEFAIAIFGEDALSVLDPCAENILARFTSPFKIDDRTVAVGVSIGIACRQNEALTASEVMRRADVALYAAKRVGKMRICRYAESLDEAQTRARAIECDLRTALENDEFSLVYQPLFDHLGVRIRSVEALLRWQRPHGERIDPVEFIPIAEYSGLIDKIGLWVIRRACLDGLNWGDINVAVNVSSAQLSNPEFPRLLSQLLEDINFPPIRLELEISERFLAGDIRQAQEVIEEIRQTGVSVVLDEYGSGQSSVGFLRHFNFSKLKVDRALSADASTSDVTRTVIQANIAVARALGMAVTIAGIETEVLAGLMRVSGCDELQGWHLSGELPPEEVSVLVTAQCLADTQQRRA